MPMSMAPTYEEIDRVVAGHSIEMAMTVSTDPEMILQLAQINFEAVLGMDSEWPARRILH